MLSVKSTDFLKDSYFPSLNRSKVCSKKILGVDKKSVKLTDLYKLLYFQTLNCPKINFFLKNEDFDKLNLFQTLNYV